MPGGISATSLKHDGSVHTTAYTRSLEAAESVFLQYVAQCFFVAYSHLICLSEVAFELGKIN